MEENKMEEKEMEENEATEPKHKVVSCENGHWFDELRYEKCPHCGAPKASDQEQKSKNVGKIGSAFGWLHKKPEGKKKKSARVPEEERAAEEQSAEKSEGKKSGAEDRSTKGIFRDGQKEKKQVSIFEEKDPVQNEDKPVEEQKVSDQNSTEAEERAQELKDMVQQASANTMGKTMGYFQKKIESEEYSLIEPVVGWLVCVKGPHIGAAYELHAGKNALGRSGENAVVLDRDMSVSRQCHATVIYEPKKREFYVQAGESSGLTYYREELLLTVSKMEPRSVIGVGETQLMLVPLCGPDFNWEEHLKKKGESV